MNEPTDTPNRSGQGAPVAAMPAAFVPVPDMITLIWKLQLLTKFV